MGTGYTRNDTANNIADGNVINASDLDGEFDAIQAAFNATTGHSHDGTTGEGPQIGTGGIADNAVTLGTKTTGNYVATAGVSGVGLSGSASAEGATFTVTSNATDANTASTIVARDASGNFSAGNVTVGNLITAGNVDGRDVSADGSKLDGIEAGATADQTKADIDALGINAATLDSLDSTQFLRSDAADTKTSGDLSFADNVKAQFGASNDLQIWHNSTGGYSIIRDAGTGDLYIEGSANIRLRDPDGRQSATFIPNGSQTFYHANSAKLATTSSGIDVTGTVTADGLTVEGSTAPTINIKSTDTVVVANDVVGAITFEESDATGGTGVQAFIKAIANDSGSTYDMSIGVGGNTEAIRIDQSGYVGIGTAPSTVLHLNDTTDPIIRLQRGGGVYSQVQSDGAGSLYLSADAGNTGSSSRMQFNVDGSEAARIDSSQNFLVGKTSASVANDGIQLEASGTLGVTRANDDVAIFNRKSSDGNIAVFRKDGTNVGSIASRSGIALTINSQSGNGNLAYGGTNYVEWNNTRLGVATDNTIDLGRAAGRWKDAYFSGYAYASYFAGQSDTNTYVHFPGSDVMQFNTGGSERARLDASGNLLVGKTANGIANTGNEFAASGYAYHTRSGGITLYCNRLTSDGGIAQFRKAGVSIGEIGVDGGDNLYLTGQTGNTGGIYMNDAAVSPAYQGAERDAYYDLGKGAARWKDLYLSGQANVGTAVAATQSASVTGSTTLDFSTYQNFILTMTGNITLAQPSTEQAGQSGFIIFIHSGAARTVSLGADYETAGAVGLTLSGTSGAVDLVPYVVQSSGNILLGTPQLAFA